MTLGLNLKKESSRVSATVITKIFYNPVTNHTLFLKLQNRLFNSLPVLGKNI